MQASPGAQWSRASWFKKCSDGVVVNQFSPSASSTSCNREGGFRITLDSGLPTDTQVAAMSRSSHSSPWQENQRTLIISVPVKSFREGILLSVITDTETKRPAAHTRDRHACLT
ncbi:MAG: hypothetical protein IPK32_16840 [Verrucomicrobiaceae bacterium]|nr:hypothetical protein [Verrucomicrobiaceae bacterium]